MRFSPPLPVPPGIAATALWLPPDLDPAEAAVAAGRVEADTAADLGYRGLADCGELAAPEMAVLAAERALAAAGWSGEDLSLVVHAWTYHQGHDFWSPPHYVAHQLGAKAALAVGVQQMCNGAAAALEIAASRMAADPAITRCLVSTADRFGGPGFDRWSGDYQTAYGDAATAVLLDRAGTGPYQLLSIVSAGAPEYEFMHRGDDPFSDAPRAYSDRVDVRRTKRAFMATGVGSEFEAALREAVLRVAGTALAEAGLAADDPRVRYIALPRIGTGGLVESFVDPVRGLNLRHAEVLDLGRGTGHLGAGDCLANLADVHAAALLAPGEVALLLSVGGGFTWSCAAVRAV